MDEQYYLQLYEKSLTGNCTAEERTELDLYISSLQLEDNAWPLHLRQKDIERKMFHVIHKRIRPRQSAWRRYQPYITVAASLAIIAIGLAFYFRTQHSRVDQISQGGRQQMSPAKPGSGRAVLILSNGTSMSLDDTNKGLVAEEGSSSIEQVGDGELIYASSGGKAQHQESQIYNILHTPRGGEYRVILSDGTKVWLNAASRLRFPAEFRGDIREVELAGEAYFEVAKNERIPFRVKVKGAAIDVLGTHFNVMAYEDEKKLVTTLLEGSVKFSNEQAAILLKPGQEAVQNSSGALDIHIRMADIERAVAWRKGRFIFKDEPIEQVMRQVARWYDLDIVYQGNVKNKSFGGKVSRFNSLEDLLEMLELTGSVHFNVEGRRVTVMP